MIIMITSGMVIGFSNTLDKDDQPSYVPVLIATTASAMILIKSMFIKYLT